MSEEAAGAVEIEPEELIAEVEAKPQTRDNKGRFAEDMANADKWLKENLKDEDDDEQPEAEVKPAKGEPKKEPKAKADALTDSDDKDEAPKVEDKSRKVYEGHLTQLRLAGYTDEALEGLSEAKIATLGVIAKTRNDDFNQRLQQASTTKDKAAPATDSEPRPTDDLVKQAAQHFREKYEGEYGQELEDFGGKLVEAATQRISQENAALQATVHELAFDSVRSSLKERFPQAATHEGSEVLLNKMAELGQAKAHTSLKALARDAAMVLWGDQAIESAEKEAAALAKRKAKLAGQPRDGARDVKPRPTKNYDLESAALAAMRGESNETIRDAYNPGRRA